jgi:hypothetical protein
MYVRNVKQILRQGGFDDRRYGFGGIMDVVRALQKDGLVRTERDRRGGLRVFPGQSLERVAAVAAPVLPQPDVEEEAAAYEAGETSYLLPVERGADEPVDAPEEEERAQPEYEPIPPAIDTTAELLGRATKRGARARKEPAAPKKPAAKRTRKPKAKKEAAEG